MAAGRLARPPDRFLLAPRLFPAASLWVCTTTTLRWRSCRTFGPTTGIPRGLPVPHRLPFDMRFAGRIAAGLILSLVLVGTARAAPFFPQVGNTMTMSNADVRLEYNLAAGTADFYWKNTKIIS